MIKINAAPTGMPLELMISAINSRTMQFTWTLPEPTMRNGIITGYSLTCSITATGAGQISDSYSPRENNTYRLLGFRPGTQYTCQVVAMNSAGSGPSAETRPTSPEDGKLFTVVAWKTFTCVLHILVYSS